MKRWIIRIVVLLAAVEIIYLAAINTILNLPATQSYINGLRPERVTYHWDRAWSWYPFRVHATGFAINGQSWSQQWQLSAPAISTSVAFLPLFAKTAHLYDLDTGNLDIRFRPRPRPDLDDAAIRHFYPTIEGRDPASPADPVPSQTPGWKIVYEARIGGENQLWLGPTRMTLVGEARATVNRQNLNGPLEISDGEADARVTSLNVIGQEVTNNGSIRGTFDVASYLPQENLAFKMLAFLSLDADIDLPVEGLEFLDIYLRRISGLDLSGKGSLKGHIVFDKGDLAAGSDITITADDLAADLAPYSAKGNGSVAVSVDSTTPDTLNAAFRFSTLSAFHDPGNQTLFTGTDLQIVVDRTTRILPGAVRAKVPRRVALTIPNITVPDIAAYQGYIPDKWQAELLSGSGSLDGTAELAADSLAIDLTLRSDDADVRFREDAFETALVLGVKAKGETDDTAARLDVSNTYLDLDDSRLKTGDGSGSDPWRTTLTISEGEASFDLPPDSDAAAGYVGFWSLFHGKDLKSMLATVDGHLVASLKMSDLDWVNGLFKNPYSLVVHNPAEVDADVTVRSGSLETGSTIKMQPSDFRLGILDYVAQGTGGFDLVVEEGGENPDIRLDAKLANGSLRLQEEKSAVVEKMTLSVTATAKGVSLKDGGAVKTAQMSIPSAVISDMSAYNVYLPKSSPVRLLGGTANLSAKLDMEESTASGFVKLETSRIAADLDGERISGSLALDVAINGGSAQARKFDIGGTTLAINGVQVSGAHATGGNWGGRVDISKGTVVWKRPMNLDFSAGIRMTDARPILAIFEAHRKSNRWLDRILDLKDIRGEATLKVAPNELVVPYSFARSETIDVGAKGIFREGDRQGVFYARYGKLSGVLVVDGSRKRFEILGATRKFDDYVAGGPLPGLSEVETPAATGERRGPFSIFRRR